MTSAQFNGSSSIFDPTYNNLEDNTNWDSDSLWQIIPEERFNWKSPFDCPPPNDFMDKEPSLGFQAAPKPLYFNPPKRLNGSDDISQPQRPDPVLSSLLPGLYQGQGADDKSNLSQAEQIQIMDDVRQDLVGVDYNNLKGPLRQLAKQNAPLQSRQNPRKQMSIDGQAKTVSPQEAFLDFDDIAMQQQQSTTAASAMFAPLTTVYNNASPKMPPPQPGFSFNYPQNAVKWTDQRLPNGSEINFADYFSPEEDKAGFALDPALGTSTDRTQRYRQKAPQSLSTNGMPLLSRAAEESYMLNQNHTGSFESASGSEVSSRPTSPQDSFSSFSDAVRTPSSTSLNSHWLSGPPSTSLPSPAIDLSGQPRDPRNPSASIATQGSPQGATQSQAVPESRASRSRPPYQSTNPTTPPIPQDSSLRSTINDDDVKADEQAEADDAKRAHKPQALQARDDRSMTPKRKRELPNKDDFERARPSYREYSQSDFEPESGDEDYNPDDFEIGEGVVDENAPKRRRRSIKDLDTALTPTTASRLPPASIAGPSKPSPSRAATIICEHLDPITAKKCGVAFRRPYDLARHKDTIHNTSAAKPTWECSSCKHHFSRKDALLRHQRLRGHK